MAPRSQCFTLLRRLRRYVYYQNFLLVIASHYGLTHSSPRNGNKWHSASCSELGQRRLGQIMQRKRSYYLILYLSSWGAARLKRRNTQQQKPRPVHVRALHYDASYLPFVFRRKLCIKKIGGNLWRETVRAILSLFMTGNMKREKLFHCCSESRKKNQEKVPPNCYCGN